MTSWLAAGFLVAGFMVLAKRLGLVDRSAEAVAVSRRSLAILRDGSLGDDAKEAAMRHNALRLFRLAFALGAGAAAAVGLPFVPLWAADRLGWLSLDAACATALSPAFLAASCSLMIVGWFVFRKNQGDGPKGASQKSGQSPDAQQSGPSPDAREGENYSALDRVLHRVAFRTTAAQVVLADIEDRLFAKRLAEVRAERPVFITALPRAGTTLLLECCAGMREFAAHCYRDMPFVLTPCLWRRFSASFQRQGHLRERAHGDGMLIDFDSPEALEEVLWKTFWPRHYRADRVVPWGDEEDGAEEFAEFRDFFRNHVRKIAWARRGDDAPQVRYLSKNNLNIARAALVRKLFPDAAIVVPFRDPLQHAESLLKQHRNFLRIHREDPFASEYMRALGHFDFGENLRPVDFDGWFDRRETRDPESVGFWLEYWAAAYRHLLAAEGAFIRFVDYDDLCANPERGLASVAEAIECREPAALLAAAEQLHPARLRMVDVRAVSSQVLREVDRVYNALRAAAKAGRAVQQPLVERRKAA